MLDEPRPEVLLMDEPPAEFGPSPLRALYHVCWVGQQMRSWLLDYSRRMAAESPEGRARTE